MAKIKIKIGDGDMGGEDLSSGAFNHEEHMEKMLDGIRTAISQVESGEGRAAVQTLKVLLGEEEKEEKEEGVAKPRNIGEAVEKMYQ